MNKQLVFTVIKTLLTAVGTFIVGKNIWGNQIDNSALEIVIGAIMAAGSIAWSIIDKTAGIEQIQATLRQIVTGIGGLLVGWGKFSAQSLEIWLAAALPLVTLIYSIVSKKKTDQIASGKLVVVESVPEKVGEKPKVTISKPKDVASIDPPAQDIIGKNN